MNWQNVIEYGKLIYRSNGSDEPFCNWSVKKIQCNVSYYEVYSLDDIDVIVCSILSDSNGKMNEEEMATILGFNVKDDFDMSPKRYKDVAELELFRGIIKPVYQWGLIEKGEGSSLISLTELGKRAFERKEKYKFLSGRKTLLENWRINADSDDDSIFFPYYQEFGVYAEIQASISIDYKKIDVSLFDALDTDLIRRLKLQSNKEYNIYAADETHNYSIGSIKVDLGLYQFENQYYPIIFYQDNICHLATDILNNDVNISLKDKKIEWGLYLRLMNDPMAVLDYKTLLPFEDIIEIDDLISDKRLAWSDDELFRLITSRADANQHTEISNYCPVEVIKKHLLSNESTDWDWIVLSKRIDEDFILGNPLFQWDFEIISSREDVSIDTIKTLLLIPDLKDVEWNWDNIMPKLNFQFIKDNIENIDFDLYNLTETNDESTQFLVSHYPSKRWNWNYVSTKYDLDFILNNITIFLYVENGKTDNKLNLKTVIDRAFTNSDYAEKYADSDSFMTTILSCKESLSYLSVNQSNYHWSDVVISFLEKTGLLVWQSGTYTDGFECNPFVEWNKNYFDKFSHKVTTEKGFSFVSKSIKNPQIVIDNKDFKWNWLDLSENENLISDENFVKQCLESFALEVLLPKLDCSLIERLFQENNLKDLLIDDNQLWHIVTQKVSVEYVRKTIGYNWDWSVLTQRFYSTLKLDAIGNEKWIDKWDWNFLTSNLDKQFIKNNLRAFANYWNWDSLQRRFTTNELTTLTLINKSSIFKWDYEYLYSLSDFDIDTYLNSYNVIDKWIELSGSPALNNRLKYDSVFSHQVWFRNVKEIIENRNYHWNFKKLSLLNSINSDFQILLLKTEYWDWQYLTEHSGIFKGGKYFQKNFERFKKYIDFKILSARTDSGVNQELIEQNIESDWDWSALTNNISITFTPDFIQKYKDKNWDWKSLSSKTSVQISNDFLYKLLDKDWDWQEISKRNDIVFDEYCIEQLKSKPLDWFAVSRKYSFVPNQKTLSWLKGETLDWEAISQNTHLDASVFYDYKDLLNWKFVTKRIPTDTKELEKFKDYLDWSEINSRQDFVITDEILDAFADYIDWSKASQSKSINFTEELIEKYRDKWNWHHLKNNPVVIDRLDTSLSKFKAEINCVVFIERFPQIPYIYHFTHLFNAVDIIRSRKILSREKVEKMPFFNHCSGFIGRKRSLAYTFARFYYRPLTPNQLYNECLGIDSDLLYDSWEKDELGHWQPCKRSRRSKYEMLGMPKMPFPICFKFDLEEILAKMSGKCYYSNGCMQDNHSQKFKVTDSPCHLNTDKLYWNLDNYTYPGEEQFKHYSQQEFLVKDEFDFANLSSFSIICYNFDQASLLRSYLKDDPIVEKITTNEHNEIFNEQPNRELGFIETDNAITFVSEYQEDYSYLVLKSDNIQNIALLPQSSQIIKESSNCIFAYPEIGIQKTNEVFEVYFVDDNNQEWLIYKN